MRLQIRYPDDRIRSRILDTLPRGANVDMRQVGSVKPGTCEVIYPNGRKQTITFEEATPIQATGAAGAGL